MFKIVNKNQILVNRGDVGAIDLSIPLNPCPCQQGEGTEEIQYYVFTKGDIITFAVYNTNSYQKDPVIYKEVEVEEDDQTVVQIVLEPSDTWIGDIINNPVQYWYEIQLNKEQTILGWDTSGPKLFILFPEGSDIN